MMIGRTYCAPLGCPAQLYPHGDWNDGSLPMYRLFDDSPPFRLPEDGTVENGVVIANRVFSRVTAACVPPIASISALQSCAKVQK